MNDEPIHANSITPNPHSCWCLPISAEMESWEGHVCVSVKWCYFHICENFFYSIFLLSFNPSINIRNGFEILKSMLMWIPDQGESPILSLNRRREQNLTYSQRDRPPMWSTVPMQLAFLLILCWKCLLGISTWIICPNLVADFASSQHFSLLWEPRGGVSLVRERGEPRKMALGRGHRVRHE